MRTYKRKLKLTKAQEQRLLAWIGVCRLVYNMGMEIKNESYKAIGKSTSQNDLEKQMTELRHEFEWVKDLPYECLGECLKRLELSYKTFFRTFKKGGGFPKYASKKLYKSIAFRQSLEIDNNKIWIAKLGWIKMFTDSPIIGDIKRATIKIEPTGFFICIQCDNVPVKFVSENQTIGLDMGLSHFCVDSNGCFIENPKYLSKYERQLKIEHRSLSRKVKGSNSFKKQAIKLSLLHHKIANIRKDFLQKESTKIAKANSTVYMEDLNIQGMSKNKNLSKYILDAGWGLFKAMLEYKTSVILVDAKYTSQQCNKCGHTTKENRKSQSQFQCVNCGHTDNADINASHNIKSRGTTLSRKRESIDCALALESTNKDVSE